MDSLGYVSLNYVVQQVMLDLDDPTMHQADKYLQYAINGLTDLSLYTLQGVKVAYLPINTQGIVDLPSDYIKYSKIGYDNGGKFVTLGLNEDLMLARKSDECGIPLNNNERGCNIDENIFLYPSYGYYYAPHYRNGRYVGELYGATGGQTDSSYRVDRERRQILFDSSISLSTTLPITEIILEYLSSGVDKGGETVIDRQVIPCLKAYIHWQLIEFNGELPLNIKQRRQELYYIEYQKLRKLELSFTKDEYFDAVYSTYTQSPKR